MRAIITVLTLLLATPAILGIKRAVIEPWKTSPIQISIGEPADAAFEKAAAV